MFELLAVFCNWQEPNLSEYSPRRRSAGSATPAEGRRRSGEDGDLLRGDPLSAESRSLEVRPEAGYLLLATTYPCLSIGIAALLMGLTSVEKPAASKCLFISR